MHITVLPQYIAATIANAALTEAATQEQLRTTPREGIQSAGEAANELQALAKKRVVDLGYDSPTNKIAITGNIPTGSRDTDIAVARQLGYAGHKRAYKDGKHAGSQIYINPNLGSEAIAHELGHHVTDQTKIGHAIRSMRSNPKTTRAVAAAVAGLPLLNSALQEGDDDFGTGLAIASLLSAPTLIDEALATKNGLALLKDQGRPATPGQRTRLAGGYLSYAAVPIISAMFGNAAGNVLDNYSAVYNVGEGETGQYGRVSADTGELPM